jgi:hypothetical protein
MLESVSLCAGECEIVCLMESVSLCAGECEFV